MKIKKDNGLAGVDVIIAIIAVMIFSTLIISLISNNVMENVKLKKETLAMIYITEIFENIAIEDYENVTETNIDNFLPEEIGEEFQVEMQVTQELEGVANNENILKKVEVTLTYDVGDKTYTCSMQRMKIKE